MGKNSTPEQLEAINGRDSNLLVSAAAGSGKTSVLIDRILGRVFDEENPIDIDQLLVVTFSKAAAAEMRERLAKELGNPALTGKDLQRAKKQQVLLVKSNITTIHSFCLDTIKENFHFLDIDPSFRVADDSVEIDMLSEEVLETLFDQLYEEMYASAEDNRTIETELDLVEITERAQAFARLLDCYGGNRSDQEFAKVVLKIWRYCMNEANPVGWLDDAVNSLKHSGGEDFAKTIQGGKILELVSDILAEQLDLMRMGLETVQGDEGLQGYEKNFLSEIKFIETVLSLFGKSSWDEINGLISTFSFARLGSAKKTADEESKNFAKSIRDGFKKELEKLQKAFFYGNSEKLFEELEFVRKHLKDLCFIVKAFMENFKKEKNRLNLIDFNDMEHLALELFEDTKNGVAEKYRKRFVEIYIDEYQDSNRVQETILTSISRKQGEPPEYNMFMVGDLKQSIYGFRKADPTLFKEKLKTYQKDKKAQERLVVLNKNFRSREEIVLGANDIMSSVMSDKVGDIDYAGDEALVFGAAYYGKVNGLKPGVSIELIDKLEKDEALIDTDDETIEAAHIAKRIKTLVNENYPVWDNERASFRPAQYRDFAILMRSPKSFAPYLEEELVSEGVPYFIESSGGYFDTLEISLIISLLKILDNPRQDIPLISVLRSTIGNFTDSELVLLRALDKNADFYELLNLCAEQDGMKEERAKTLAFLEKLGKWRKDAIYMPSDKLLWMLFEETDLYNFVGVLPKGKQRQANLRFLYEKAAMYEKTSFKGLFNFVKYLERQIEKELNAEKAKLSGSGQNVVRIMSVHKSKGLEYPIVILCNTGKQFNMMDSKETLLIHGKLGFGPDVFKLEENFKYPSILKECIKYELKRENLSEEMRILYVALTRAKEKLILIGTGKKIDEKLSEYSTHADGGRIPGYLVLKGKSFLDWLVMYISSRPVLMAGKEAPGVTFERIETEVSDKEKELEQATVELQEMKASQGIDASREMKASQEMKIFETPQSAEIKQKVISILEFEYPFEKDTKRPGKTSVTGIKKRKLEDSIEEAALDLRVEELDMKNLKGEEMTAQKKEKRKEAFSESMKRKPRFFEEEQAVSGAALGTATHFIMQLVDFNMEPTIEAVDSFVKRLKEQELLTKAEENGINRGWIANFLKSEICRRIKASTKVIREGAFKLMIPANEAGFIGAEKDGEMLLQGIVDCMFLEDGKWVLLDYKTDYYEKGGAQALGETYGIQLEWYGRAVEKGTKTAIKEKLLYLFRGDELVSIN